MINYNKFLKEFRADFLLCIRLDHQTFLTAILTDLIVN